MGSADGDHRHPKAGVRGCQLGFLVESIAEGSGLSGRRGLALGVTRAPGAAQSCGSVAMRPSVEPAADRRFAPVKQPVLLRLQLRLEDVGSLDPVR